MALDLLKRNLNCKKLLLEEKEEAISKFFGLNHSMAEESVSTSEPNLYRNLMAEAFSTPFEDYHSIFNDLPEGERLVDLGAGYGKGTLLAEGLGLSGRCLSLEIDPDRVKHAKKLARNSGLDEKLFQLFDLTKEAIPLSDSYLVYLPLGELIFQPIERLLMKKHSCVFYVVESHGDLVDFFENAPLWFKLDSILPSRSKRHREGIFKFRFTPQEFKGELENSYNAIYWLVQEWSKKRPVLLKKESGQEIVCSSSLLPIKYNKQMAFECFHLKRIVDFKNVQISETSEPGLKV